MHDEWHILLYAIGLCLWGHTKYFGPSSSSSSASSSYFILQHNIKQIRIITVEYKNMPEGCQRSKRSLNWPPVLLYHLLVGLQLIQTTREKEKGVQRGQEPLKVLIQPLVLRRVNWTLRGYSFLCRVLHSPFFSLLSPCWQPLDDLIYYRSFTAAASTAVSMTRPDYDVKCQRSEQWRRSFTCAAYQKRHPRTSYSCENCNEFLRMSEWQGSAGATLLNETPKVFKGRLKPLSLAWRPFYDVSK